MVVDTGGGLKMVTADDYVYGLGRYIVSTDYADNSAGSQQGIYSMVVTKKGDLFTLDMYNHCIRKVTIN